MQKKKSYLFIINYQGEIYELAEKSSLKMVNKVNNKDKIIESADEITKAEYDY